MNTFLVYLVKITVLLTVFDAFFLLVMRRSGWFRFNRIVLLAGSAACLLLPLIPLKLSVPTVYSLWLEPAVAGSGAVAGQSVAETAAPAAWPTVLLAIYLICTLATLVFYVRSYTGMFRLLKRIPGQRRDGYTLHILQQEAPSFSWLRHIAISRSDYQNYPAILTHEQAHVRFGHTCDLLFSSILTVFQWFNPLVWICQSELKQLHEYEADDFVLNQGIDATQYQLLLVKKAVGEKRFLLANGFNHAQLKNRITMMQLPKSAAWKKLSLLLLLPLLGGTMLLLAECTARDNGLLAQDGNEAAAPLSAEPQTKATPAEANEAVPFKLIEQKPRFNDGDAYSFSLWVNQNLNYPPEAVEKKLQGRVTLQFTLETDGSVTNVKVLRGIDPLLDNEAVRIISQSPKWTPGYKDGKPVRIIFNYPVIFKLNE